MFGNETDEKLANTKNVRKFQNLKEIQKYSQESLFRAIIKALLFLFPKFLVF